MNSVFLTMRGQVQCTCIDLTARTVKKTLFIFPSSAEKEQIMDGGDPKGVSQEKKKGGEHNPLFFLNSASLQLLRSKVLAKAQDIKKILESEKNAKEKPTPSSFNNKS